MYIGQNEMYIWGTNVHRVAYTFAQSPLNGVDHEHDHERTLLDRHPAGSSCTGGMDDIEDDEWMPDVDELIADDQAIGAAAYDELEDNDYMMIQAGEDDARRRSDAGDDDQSGEGGEGRAEGDGWGGIKPMHA